MYKYPQIYENKNKEMQNLSIDYKNDRYITLFLPKISNCPLNPSIKTRSLTYLVIIKSKKY